MAATPETVTAEAPPKAGGGKKWLLIVGAVLLAGAAVGGWLLLTGVGHRGPAPPPPVGPPLYVALDPPFVTNFQGEQQARFLQITAEVMTHDQATAELVKADDPVIRNDLLLLFSNQKAADLATREGKERLRSAALATVRQVLEANGGRNAHVDAVLFTSFVMQ
jgi:flagellar protein FliL